VQANILSIPNHPTAARYLKVAATKIRLVTATQRIITTAEVAIFKATPLLLRLLAIVPVAAEVAEEIKDHLSIFA